SVALQLDGKIVGAGEVAPDCVAHNDFLLIRCNPDGSLDPSFGFGGVVRTQLSRNSRMDSFDEIVRVFVRSDGKILAVGNSDICNNPNGTCVQGGDHTDSGLVLARYNPDGSLDTTFGQTHDGLVIVTFGPDSDDVVLDAALRPDGKIAVLERSYDRS